VKAPPPFSNEQLFKFFLARELGMSVAQLDQEVSPEELNGWFTFYRYEHNWEQGPVPPPKYPEAASTGAEDRLLDEANAGWRH
jgi:hypothetical protein